MSINYFLLVSFVFTLPILIYIMPHSFFSCFLVKAEIFLSSLFRKRNLIIKEHFNSTRVAHTIKHVIKVHTLKARER